MKTYTYAYGHGTKTFSLPEEAVLKEIEVAKLPVLEDVAAAALEAVYHPIGAEPLDKLIKPGQKIVFICNDPTRVAGSEVFMPVLVNEMNRLGIKDEDMSIVFACGTHRLMTEAEMAEQVGAEVASRLKMYNSDARQPDDFVYFGTTSRGTPVWINKLVCGADHIIMTGTVVHHYFAGYGGGRKAILPGVASLETATRNHSLMLDENAMLGKLAGNPIYDDQMEGVKLFAKGRSLFLFNAVLNAEHQFLKIFAGDYEKAHLEACKFADKAYGVKIPRRADIVIASCGGYPKDINVYQMQKTMDNAVCAVRQGGVVIIIGECVEGSGSALLEETCKRLGSADAIKAEIEQNFAIGPNKAYAVTRLTKKAHFIIVSALEKELAQNLLLESAASVEEALERAKEITGPDPSYILMPMGSLTVPLTE
ncbi:MAG: nickel-dependent lactate racemase [Phascolarctobacterium sp.]|nr:MAG: nickel-dependent lactate racemase [Phascolarctobacterium sp.]